MVQALWKRFGSLSESKTELLYSNTISKYIPKRIVSRNLTDNLYTNVHSTIIPNSQKVETTQMSHKWTSR